MGTFTAAFMALPRKLPLLTSMKVYGEAVEDSMGVTEASTAPMEASNTSIETSNTSLGTSLALSNTARLHTASARTYNINKRAQPYETPRHRPLQHPTVCKRNLAEKRVGIVAPETPSVRHSSA